MKKLTERFCRIPQGETKLRNVKCERMLQYIKPYGTIIHTFSYSILLKLF